MQLVQPTLEGSHPGACRARLKTLFWTICSFIMKTNHRRSFKAPRHRYGGSPPGSTGKTSTLADVRIGADWGGDNANGHQGYARNKLGGKKFVRSRIRFHENAAVRKMSAEE